MLAAGPVLVIAWAACNGQQIPSTLLHATVPCDLGCSKNNCSCRGNLATSVRPCNQQHRGAAAELRQQ
eukprot:11174090-Alexandrium_andersonii.AAC.1